MKLKSTSSSKGTPLAKLVEKSLRACGSEHCKIQKGLLTDSRSFSRRGIESSSEVRAKAHAASSVSVLIFLFGTRRRGSG